MPVIIGGAAADIITPGVTTTRPIGTRPSFGADTIDGGGGNDTIDGGGGNDWLLGGADDDSVAGGTGADTVFGGTGADTLLGGFGNDLLKGEQGNDRLDLTEAGIGDLWEMADGGEGADLLMGHQAAVKGANVFLAGGAGDDTIRGYGVYDNVADYGQAAQGIKATLGTTGSVVTGAEVDTLDQVIRIRATAFNDTLSGSGAAETFMPGRGTDTISGGSGQDWIDYSDETAAVKVDIAAKQATDGGGATDSFTGIENATGGSGNDTLIGNDQVNVFRGMAGADQIDGGAGWDSVRYDLAGTTDGTAGTLPSGIIASLQANEVTDNWGNKDTLSNIEEIVGSDLADDITGRSGDNNNHLKGLGGNDTLRSPLADQPVLADYRESPQAIEINLSATDAVSSFGNTIAAGTGKDGHGFVDTFDKIQGIIGSSQGDWIQGGDQPWEYGERLLGWAGNDTIIGGWGDDTMFGGQGVDVLVGGKGMDFLSFAAYASSEGTQTQGAIANLLTGVIANDGWGNVESLGANNEFEVLLGTAFGDDFTGKKIADAGVIAEQMECQLRGGAGQDTLRAAAGDDRWVSADYMTDIKGVTVNLATQTATDGWGFQDVLINIGGTRGSAFDDVLTGNAGDNWFRGEKGNDVINGGDGVDLASWFSSENGVLVDLIAGTAQDGYGTVDTLISIEQVVGSKANNDTIFGSNIDNRLSGFGGNDRLDGRGGMDSLFGGMGADTLIGGTGADKLTGGDGADRFLWQNSGQGGDTVFDFAGGAGGDRLVFEAAGFGGGLAVGTLAAGRFVAGANAQANAGFGQFLYNTGTGALSWDADGNGAGGAVHIATFDTLPTLTASDILIG